MIKVEGQKVSLKGSPMDFSVDLTLLVGCIYEHLCEIGIPEKLAKDIVRNSFEIGLMPKDELNKKSIDAFIRIAKKVNGNGDEDDA